MEPMYRSAVLGAVMAALSSFSSAQQTLKDCADCPELVVVPAGSFLMGTQDRDAEEKPVRNVKVQSFAMGKGEVTQGQWYAIMGKRPSYFRECGDSCPVEQVSWDDSQVFVQRLSAKTGQSYRLPTEAEWEYACRGGVPNQMYCGGSDLKAVAFYDENSAGTAHPVMRKQANAFGLHDMSGNVWEWTQDCWNASYKGASNVGHARLTGDCSKRVIRGGAWINGTYNLQAAARYAHPRTERYSAFGLRVVRDLP
jgi:formylglycine-generating enzyme required for sulfatase activity